jgi:hypothetical protein
MRLWGRLELFWICTAGDDAFQGLFIMTGRVAPDDYRALNIVSVV